MKPVIVPISSGRPKSLDEIITAKQYLDQKEQAEKDRIRRRYGMQNMVLDIKTGEMIPEGLLKERTAARRRKRNVKLKKIIHKASDYIG